MFYYLNKYPAVIPSTPDKTIIKIGCIFLKTMMSIPPKIMAEIKKSSVKKEDKDIPFWKKTVFPVEITVALISPTVEGFNPVIHPFIILFS